MPVTTQASGMATQASQMTALAGLRVVECSTSMAAALAGMVLADYGAEVVKLSWPQSGWDPEQPSAVVWDRGKRSVALPDGPSFARPQVAQLLRGVDVAIEDAGLDRPGALSYPEIASANPGLVYVSISGFGVAGPLSGMPLDEGLVAALSGRMAADPDQRGHPTYTATPIASYGAAMLAVQGALTAVRARRFTGRGDRIRTSLLHALVAFDMTSGHGHRLHTPQKAGGISGVRKIGFMTAQCRDGQWIQMCSRLPHLFKRWMLVAGLTDVLDDPRFAHAPDVLPTAEALAELEERVRSRMGERMVDEWLADFSREGVGADPFISAERFLTLEQAAANGNVCEVDHPVLGRVRQIGPLARLTQTPADTTRPAPRSGEHNDEPWSTSPVRGPASSGASGQALEYPLQGVTIVECATAYATPFAATILGELGARVIKVEPPEGDLARRNWLTPYEKEIVGKECIVLDLKTPQGQDVLARLVRNADVFLHNFRPGVPERLGADYARLAELNPRLIYVYGSCYGSAGPWFHRPGFHSTPNAIVGTGIFEAGDGNRPRNRNFGDPAGALGVATATMLALHARELTGLGQYVETTMLNSLAYAIADRSVSYADRPDPVVVNQNQEGIDALHRLYRTQQGWLYLSCAPERLPALLAALDIGARPQTVTADLSTDGALAQAVAAALSTQDADECSKILGDHGIAAGRADNVRHETFMLTHPQVTANRLAIEDDIESVGTFMRSSGAIDFDSWRRRLGACEVLGESTGRILGELGYDQAAIDTLEAIGVTHAVGHGLPQ